jgi:GrpB-like predicted nucleotidyltransferase (UPF0157 family)
MKTLSVTIKRASVVLSEYDPGWPQAFEQEGRLLSKLIGNYLCGSIEHVGSTAVPGLIAKPVIDVMFGVKSLDESKSAIDILTSTGYEYSPYKSDVMHWFCKPSDAYRTHHLHLIPYESALWHERIRFRNLLRADKQIANDYSSLKKDLARRHKKDREAYTQGKWPFIKKTITPA